MKKLQGKSLYRGLVVAVLLTAASVATFAVWGVRSFREDAASMAVQNAVQQLSGTVTMLVNVMSEGGEQRQFSGLSMPELEKRLVTALDDRPQVAGVLVSGEDGLELALIRSGESLAAGQPVDGTVRWRVLEGEKPESLPTIDLITVEGRLQQERESLVPGQYSWTSAYRFHGHGESWMTISRLVADGKRMLTFVLPVSVVVNQLSHADRGEVQKLFVFWGSGKVMDISEFQSDKGFRAAKNASDENDPIVGRAVSMLSEDISLRGGVFHFSMDNDTWWVASESLSAFGDTMYLGAVMPQSRINPVMTGDRYVYAFTAFLLLLAGAALLILRRYRSRIEGAGLRRAFVSPDEIRKLIIDGENDRLEFKQTLRFNLKSGKNGREIELANLKTVAAFLNTKGGTLLIGVSDGGDIVGLDEDCFENEDRALLHFTNLLNQHVGVNFQPYVNARIVTIDGKTVIRVNCVKADRPAFLINGQSEEFYVRSGPASRKLTVRQFYEYISHHRSS